MNIKSGSNINTGVMKKIRLAVTIALVASLFSTSAFCETTKKNNKEPSEKETQEYIIDKMHGCGWEVLNKIILPNSVKLDGNNLSLVYDYLGDESYYKRSYTLTTFNRYYSGETSITLSFNDDGIREERFIMKDLPSRVSFTSMISCKNMDSETGQRLSKALYHLQDIIKSKPDPFK